MDIHEELIAQGYIKKGRLTQKYFDDKKADTLDFGEQNGMKSFIVKQLDKVFNPDDYKPANGRDKKKADFSRDNFNKKEWQELWKRINVRTYYNVNFDTSILIENAVDELDKHLNVTEIRIVVESGAMEGIRDREELEAGTAMSTAKVRTIHVTEAVGNNVTYDLVGELVQIRYEKRNSSFDTSVFDEASVRGVVGKDAIESRKSLYDLVVVDSQGIEKSFAESLQKEDDVVVYTKLPGGFYINKPMGKYNPDWAVAFREGSVKHVYFVAETKGKDIEASQLRKAEDAKIECARRHFAAISTGEVVYSVVKTYQDLYNVVIK